MATKQLSIVISAVDQATGNTAKVGRGFIDMGEQAEAGGRKANAAMDLLVSGVGRVSRAVGTGLGIGAGIEIARRGIDSLARLATEGPLSDTAEELDRVGKAAERLGLTVGQVSELRFAALLDGRGDWLAYADAVSTAQKNLEQYQVTAGGGKAADAIRILGLRLKDEGGALRTINDLLPEIADRFLQLTAAQRTFVASKLFGSTEVLNILSGGSGKILQNAADAQRLGNIFSEDQVRLAREYKDSITKVQAAWLGVKASLATEVEPYLTRFLENASKRIADIPAQVKGLGNVIVRATGTGPDAVDAADELRSAGAELLHLLAVGAVSSGKVLGTAAVESLVLGLTAARPAIADIFRDIVGPILNELPGVDIAKSLRTQLDELQSKRATLITNSVGFGGLLKDLPEAVAGADALKTRLAAIADEINQIRQSGGGTGGSTRAGFERIRELQKLQAEGVRILTQVERGVVQPAGLADLDKRIEALTARVKNQDQERAAELAGALGQALVATGRVSREELAKLDQALAPVLNRLDRFKAEGESLRPPTDESAFFADSTTLTEASGRASLLDTVIGRLRSTVKSAADEAHHLALGIKEFSREADLVRNVQVQRLFALGGDDNARSAERLKLIISQKKELDQLFAGGNVFGLDDGIEKFVRDTQKISLERFDLDTEAQRFLKNINDAREKYQEGQRERSNLVQIGRLQEFQAVRLDTNAAVEARDRIQENIDALDSLKDKYPDVTAAVQKYHDDAIRLLSEVRQQARLDPITFQEGLSAGFESFIHEAQRSGQQGEQAAHDISNAFVNDLTPAIVQTINHLDQADEAARQFGQTFLNELEAIAVRLLIIRAIGGIGGALVGGGSGDAVVQEGLPAFRAGGGPVAAGRAYVVGERGPELFVPRGSGTIVPNAALAGRAGVNIAVGDVNVVVGGGASIEEIDTRIAVAQAEQRKRVIDDVIESGRSRPAARARLKELTR